MANIRKTTHAAWWGLLRDPFVIVAIVLTVLVSIPLATPALDSSFWNNVYPFYLDTPLLALTALALWTARRRAAGMQSRAFWTYLAAGFVFWLMVRVAGALFTQTTREASLTADLLYLAFYLCLILGLQQRPHLVSQDSSDDLIRQLDSTGATLFVFGLMIYFVLIPATYNPSAMLTNIPSTMLYVVLNLYLFLRVLALRTSWGYAPWRQCYNGFLTAMAGFVLLDSIDLAARINTTFDAAIQGTLIEALWLLPLLGLIAAARIYTRSAADTPTVAAAENREKLILAWRGKLAYFALVPPVIHMSLEFLAWADDLTRAPREILVVVWVVAAAALSFVYDRHLLRRQQSLEERHQRVNQQLEVAQRMDAVRRMAGGLAHDFNNLMMVIRGFADVLVEKLEDGENRDDAEQIAKAALRASDLTQQLLAIGTRDKRGFRPFLPNEILKAMEPTLQQLLSTDLRLTLDLDETGHVLGDRGAFEDAVLNLVLNAREACAQGGSIHVQSSQLIVSSDGLLADTLGPGRFSVIAVTDDGKGMDEDTRSHVFEPFFTNREGGTGLGLSTVYSFAREAGGTVEVTSTPGQGSQFRIILPESHAAMPVASVEPSGPTSSTRCRTVLLVEDKSSVRSVLERLLQAAGMDVLEARDGNEALGILRRNPDGIDLVITDVVMPVMDGGTLAQHIREIDKILPIIFMTGYAGDQLDRLGPLGEESPILKKPFDVKDLLREINKSLPTRTDRAMDPATSKD
ncbi:MAG: response regulator [Gammaproteobacteria bacterium]|nr:response regulator [Gammaproteobacteria bacterium]